MSNRKKTKVELLLELYPTGSGIGAVSLLIK
jgi:hypothetical protein